jgi:hypothetical protein
MKVELLGFFYVTYLDDVPGSLVEHIDQLIVDLVNLLAEVINFLFRHMRQKTYLTGICEL